MEPRDRETIISRICQLLGRIEAEPKSMKWKMRSKIGDRIVWYDTSERVGKIGTSQ